MGKVFGKKLDNYLRTDGSKEFIKEVAASHKCEPTDLVIVRNGGNNFGTWLHQDIAIEFAGWLDVKFKIWCNDRLKELFTHGITGTDEALEKSYFRP